MKTRLAAKMVVVGLLLASPLAISAKEPTVEGKWKVQSTTLYGKESKLDVGRIYEFQADNRLLVSYPDGPRQGRYQLDASETPWRIDMETAEDNPDVGGGGPRRGIVAVEGNRLTLCIAGAASAPRPEEMTSAKGSPNIFYVMERVKEESDKSSDDAGDP